ncbi:MAG: RNA polymerase sigma factor [Vicinamibacterales bacterium]
MAERAAVPMRDHPPRVDTSGAPSGLARLLSRLAPGADEAASAYQRLRLTLERFFDWQGVWSPEECADETLDRLARKLEGDLEVEDVRRYALGIARLVVREWRRRPTAVPLDERTDVAATAPEVDEDDSLRRCFERCLDALPEESRVLVLDYYVAERRAKIDNRRRLAQSFGVSENALRSRVQRVRDRLERCVQSCAGTAARPGVARAEASLDRRRSADV